MYGTLLKRNANPSEILKPGVFLGQKMSLSALLAREEAYSASTRGMVLILNCRYIPGGRYPLLASAHMTILTAKVASVHMSSVVCLLAGQILNGTVAAMALAGADEIFILGGVQATAAMAVGAETIRKVDFIAGPGDAVVAEGKR
jgi:histidinol dehydrogenase